MHSTPIHVGKAAKVDYNDPVDAAWLLQENEEKRLEILPALKSPEKSSFNFERSIIDENNNKIKPIRKSELRPSHDFIQEAIKELKSEQSRPLQLTPANKLQPDENLEIHNKSIFDPCVSRIDNSGIDFHNRNSKHSILSKFKFIFINQW